MYGQFKRAVEFALSSDNKELTYLKTLVRGRTKLAIADVTYSGDHFGS